MYSLLTQVYRAVIGTGNTPLDLVQKEQTRYLFFDGPLDSIDDATWTREVSPLASTNWAKAIAWNGLGSPDDARAKVADLVAKVSFRIRFSGSKQERADIDNDRLMSKAFKVASYVLKCRRSCSADNWSVGRTIKTNQSAQRCLGSIDRSWIGLDQVSLPFLGNLSLISHFSAAPMIWQMQSSYSILQICIPHIYACHFTPAV